MPSRDLEQVLQQAAYRFDFFEALRLIECRHPEKPRIGTSVKAADDPVRLCQDPELAFPPSSLASYSQPENEHSMPRLNVNFMGLFGPHGALPLHLTEYARERIRHHHDPTLVRFVDIFHHRMMSLFYRAWANARPTVSYDRPDSDRFKAYVGSMLGIGSPVFHERDELSDKAKLFYAGHFAVQTKHPDGLISIISNILRIQVKIVEFVGEWMSIQTSDQTRLGYSEEIGVLGQSVLLGASVWGCQHKFRILLGPMQLPQYLALLPGGKGLAQLIAIVRNYIGDAYVWDAQLVLERNQVPKELCLAASAEAGALNGNGGAQLGWSMWLGPRNSQFDADDLRLNPFINAGNG